MIRILIFLGGFVPAFMVTTVVLAVWKPPVIAATVPPMEVMTKNSEERSAAAPLDDRTAP